MFKIMFSTFSDFETGTPACETGNLQSWHERIHPSCQVPLTCSSYNVNIGVSTLKLCAANFDRPALVHGRWRAAEAYTYSIRDAGEPTSLLAMASPSAPVLETLGAAEAATTFSWGGYPASGGQWAAHERRQTGGWQREAVAIITALKGPPNVPGRSPLI